MTPAVRSVLENKIGKIAGLESLHGGSINQCYRVSCYNSTVFCKVNSASEFPELFEKEKAGLEILRSNNILTPAVIACFEENGLQFLVMEWIEESEPDSNYWKKTGEALADLHQVFNEYWGLHFDNYMGSVAQDNRVNPKWTDFFIQQRLVPLVEKCNKAFDKRSFIQFEALFKKLPEIYPERKPSLLHGDLWNGNLLCNKNHEPVFIDPAIYYGHHSVDIGMTKLFGGFHYSFMDAYTSCIETDPNFHEQCEISNIYPLLIHLYLFGGHYRLSVEDILKKYTS
jgi:protein-ribulosamine 3-kinase